MVVKSEVKLVVVPNGFTDLLGLKTIQKLGFITINKECFIFQIKAPQLGDLGEATLRIDESAPHRVFPCKKIPLAIEEPVREELDQFVEKKCTCSCDGAMDHSNGSCAQVHWQTTHMH